MANAIEIRNLHFSYPDGKQVLRGVSLDIPQGESVGIIGANGAGKTTLLLHLNGILQGDGEITILGQKMNHHNLKALRVRVGIVYQDPDDQLFSSTVFDDVSFGPLNMNLADEDVIQRTHEALAQVGMSGFEQRLPHHLSLGEKKSISISTVLSMTPEIMVLDEPTSNLDFRQRKNLIAVLKRTQVTKIIASHDLPMIMELCERVILMSKGAVVHSGRTFDVLRNATLMEANGLESVASV